MNITSLWSKVRARSDVDSMWSVGGSVFLAVTGLVQLALVAHAMSDTWFGLLVAASGVQTVCASFGAIGSELTLVRYLTPSRGRLGSSHRRALGEVFAISAAASGALGVIGWAVLRWAIARHDVWPPWFPWWFCIASVAWAWGLVANGTLRGAFGTRTQVVVDRLIRPSVSLIAMVVALAVHRPWLAITVWFMAPFVSAAACIGLVVRARRGPALLSPFAYWRSATHRAGADGATALSQRLDAPLAAALIGPAAAGAFGVLVKLGAGLILISSSVSQAASPHLAVAAAHGRERFREVFDHYRKVTVFATAVPLLGVLVLGSTLMSSAFAIHRSVGVPLVVILIGTFVAVVCGPVDVALVMQGRAGTSTLISVASATTLVVGLVALRHHGLLGASLAYSASLLVANLAALAVLGRLLADVDLPAASGSVA
jgi:O-antigen/teichoic acid export membrane protein